MQTYSGLSGDDTRLRSGAKLASVTECSVMEGVTECSVMEGKE